MVHVPGSVSWACCGAVEEPPPHQLIAHTWYQRLLFTKDDSTPVLLYPREPFHHFKISRLDLWMSIFCSSLLKPLPTHHSPIFVDRIRQSIIAFPRTYIVLLNMLICSHLLYSSILLGKSQTNLWHFPWQLHKNPNKNLFCASWNFLFRGRKFLEGQM